MWPRNWPVLIQTLVFVAVTLFGVTALLVWITQERWVDFQRTQTQLMDGAVQSTTNELSFLIQDLRRRVDVFAEEHQAQVLAIAEEDSEAAFDSLKQAIKRRFPTSFAFTVADAFGTPLAVDFDGLVGDICRQDIQGFAHDPTVEHVFVHPHPLGYHFDIMANRAVQAGDGVFFVSFLLEDISRLLKNGQLPGHQLILTHQDSPDLIEVTADGGRNQLQREYRLSVAEQARIGAQRLVPGSRWRLIDIYPPGLLNDRERELWRDAGIALAALFTVSIVLLLTVAHGQRQLEESQAQLVQADKMASLGQMVAGLAHEMNTPLAYVRSNLSVVSERLTFFQQLLDQSDRPEERQAFEQALAELRELELLPALRQVTGESIAGIDEIKELVANLKDFSRLERKALDQVRIEQCLEQALKILQHKLGSIRVERECAATPNITAVPSQLNQVFLNLINNAIQAVDPEQGVIHLRTWADRDSVMAEVEDNGAGVPGAVRKKIFDPFFTTKAVGEGTGLGLAIVYRIIQNHGGQIHVDSKPGEGARFTITLPRQGS